MRTLPCSLLIVLLLGGLGFAQDDTRDLGPGLYGRIKTSMGTMIVRLEYERAPRTVANFVGLAEGTKAFKDRDGKWVKRPFYDGLTFHRVIDGFMIQGGCPLGTGTSGPGFSFRDETHRELTHKSMGVLSMANSDRGKTPWTNAGNTNGSQFFLTLKPTSHLDGLHSVFGQLVKGDDVLKAIGKTPTDSSDKPNTPVVVESVTIVRQGVGKKVIPPAQGEGVDATTEPNTQGPPQDRVRVELLCVQYQGCERAKAEVALTKAEALGLAKLARDHARLKGADFTALSKRFSDIAAREYLLVRAQNDPSFAPAYLLQPGQVSQPFVTPYGVMVARAIKE